MIEDPQALLPLWMLLSAAAGFMAGEAVGDSIRHRKCLEQANEDLQIELAKQRVDQEPLRRLLEQQHAAISDIHGYLLPGSKGSRKPTS